MKTSPKSTTERFAVRLVREDEREVLWFDEAMTAPHLVDADSTILTRRGLLRQIRSQQDVINKLQAQQLEAIARFAAMTDGERGSSKELALAWSVTRHRTQQQIDLATELTTRFPETLSAMRRGELDSFAASKISDPAAVLSDEQAREVDAIMAGRLKGKNPESLRTSTHRAVRQADPDGYAARCENRRENRNLTLEPFGNSDMAI